MAVVDILSTGYARMPAAEGGALHVGSSVTLLRDGDTIVVVDPGMVADRRDILDPLAALGAAPEDVTDVVFSHHHPDHTLNAALFTNARYHDHMAIYHKDVWEDRDADGYELTASIRLMRTPGHTAEDISTLVTTESGLVVLTHLWWTGEGPADDPFAPDREQLRASRRLVLDLAPDLVVPGHGPAFRPGRSTPE